jgi:hypothetical protein
MLVIGYTTVLRQWKDKKPEYITEHPLLDPKQLNAAIPVGEWEIGLDGNPTPPWKLTYVIYMVDAGKTGGLFTYAHDTYGAMLCFNNLEEAIGVMRLLRGEHVLPIVHLEKRQWKSRKYGMQTRPHLHPIEWRTLGGGGPTLGPQSPTPQLAAPATAPACYCSGSGSGSGSGTDSNSGAGTYFNSCSSTSFGAGCSCYSGSIDSPR